MGIVKGVEPCVCTSAWWSLCVLGVIAVPIMVSVMQLASFTSAAVPSAPAAGSTSPVIVLPVSAAGS